jgi:ribosomal protein S18 acetylase RimI-like enzyme
MTAHWTLRTATAADSAFLVRMLVHAAYPPWHEPRPTPAEVLRDPAVARYILGWPRPGDAGVIALDRAGRRIGAAWYRLLTADEPGYGYVDDATPEVAIGIGPRWRGRRGLGTALMRRLLVLAQEEGCRRLCLSVSLANPAAVRLYRSVGFETMREDDGHLVMVWMSTGAGP